MHLWLFLLVSCPIEGQFYTAACFGTNATCSDPNPPVICGNPQCVCPSGQVTDEVARACINGSECSKILLFGSSKLHHYMFDPCTPGRACDIKRVSGNAKYNNNRKRLTLTFSTNRRGQDAIFECQIDDQQFSLCELFICNYLTTCPFITYSYV